MDPDACLVEFRIRLLTGEFNEAREHAHDLLDWLDSGGFDPDWSKVPSWVWVRLLRVFANSRGVRDAV
jgi:hypothetical protein